MKWLLFIFSSFKAFTMDRMSVWVFEIALHSQLELPQCLRNLIMVRKSWNNMWTYPDQNNILPSSPKIKAE